MSSRITEWDDRTLELALDEVTFGLGTDELAELERRLDRRELAPLERAAAAIAVSGLGRLEAPPVALVQRLQRDAQAHTVRPAVRGQPARMNWSAWTGWLAAAALLVALILRGGTRGSPAEGESPDLLVASAGDLQRASWKATNDPLASGLAGEVAWSATKQAGYMRFTGLPVNDPKVHQYQLWIFDARRADWEARPVDGGVFDVRAGGEALVPIHAKLAVREAKLFAVTLEEPGGVVVSGREHLLATAAP